MNEDELIRKVATDIEAATKGLERRLEQALLDAEAAVERHWKTEERRHREMMSAILMAAERIADRNEYSDDDEAADRRANFVHEDLERVVHIASNGPIEHPEFVPGRRRIMGADGKWRDAP